MQPHSSASAKACDSGTLPGAIRRSSFAASGRESSEHWTICGCASESATALRLVSSSLLRGARRST